MLDDITPVLLTYNEEQNIGRTLKGLSWAKDIVVVDSESTDETLTELSKFPNVRVFSRPFDTHGNQWRYAIENTQICSKWILRLDADYQLGDALIAELAGLDSDAPVSAYKIGFEYAVFSNKLRSSFYPPNTILLRKGKFSISDKGHTESWQVNGAVMTLNARILHDDWKSTSQWVIAQERYMGREREYLHRQDEVSLKTWMRVRPPIMPIAVFLYSLFGKGVIVNGRAGLYYALQRLVAEGVLALMILEERLRDRLAHPTDNRREGVKRD